MKTFYQILLNSLIATFTNNFVWFALTFWAYLETKSVLTTSFIGGSYLVATSLSGFWFGSLVDHNKKKTIMLISSVLTFIFFSLGLFTYLSSPVDTFKTITSVSLWGLAFVLMAGVVVGNIRNITLPTLVTMLVPTKERDKANGMSGTVAGISFAITSVASGLVLAYGGMRMVLALAAVFTLLTILHLLAISIPEKKIVHTQEKPKKIDIKGTIKAIQVVPGLFGLIFFTTFNNFLGGVFMSLLDAYGLTLVSVQTWGILWGCLSLGFITGGMIIAKKGLGSNPLRTLFLCNICMWTIAIFFTIQPWIQLLVAGMFVWISLIPFVEASEQTIVQKVVPLERQGRVFGFAQSVEQAASPLTAFIIGPIAQFIFIPFMTTGAGVELIGDWYGIGVGRGIALVFSITAVIGLIVTLLAIQSSAYKKLSTYYQK